MLLKKLHSELFTFVLNNRIKYDDTSFYATCVTIISHRKIEIINLLFDVDVFINKNDESYDSFLMTICIMNRFFAVKLLISKNAQTIFVRKHHITNVLHVAKHFSNIIRWLLIDKFIENSRFFILNLNVK